MLVGQGDDCDPPVERAAASRRRLRKLPGTRARALAAPSFVNIARRSPRTRRYPLGAPTEEGFDFTHQDDTFLSTPPSTPREQVTPPHSPHDLLRRDVLRAVSWDEGSPSWFPDYDRQGTAHHQGGRPRAVSLGSHHGVVPQGAADYRAWPAPGDAAWVPFEDQGGALVWHKGYVITGGGSLLQVSFSPRDVETVSAHAARREPPLGAATYVAPDHRAGDHYALDDPFAAYGRSRGSPLGKRKGPHGVSQHHLAKHPKEKKHGRKNGALSEARWAAEREKSRDPTMPEKRPVGISLASGSSSGWRLRISGTQLGHYATAQQAWAAYPRDAAQRKSHQQAASRVVEDDDED